MAKVLFFVAYPLFWWDAETVEAQGSIEVLVSCDFAYMFMAVHVGRVAVVNVKLVRS
jgi:hypothetical protein